MNKPVQWDEIGDVVCAILVKVGENQAHFKQQAARRGISLEQLLATAISGAIREQVDAHPTLRSAPNVAMSRPIEEPIPPIPEELTYPISALIRSAVRLREAFLWLADGHSIEEVLDEAEPHLDTANRVVDTWIRHMELDETVDSDDS